MKSQIKAIEKPKTEKIEMEEVAETVLPLGDIRNLAD